MSVGNPNRELHPDDRRGLAGADEDRAAPDPAEALQRDAAFLSLFRAGDPTAFGLLFDGWVDPVYDRLSHQGFTTADVCDLSVTSFRAVHRRIAERATNDPFRVVVFRSVRQELVAAADRRVQWRMPVGPYAEDRLAKGADARSLASDPAVATLLWEATDVLGERVRDVLDLHYRYRFSAREIAAVLNEPTDTVEDILRKLPMGFGAVVRAQVLWRQGTPSHAELAAELTGADAFDTTTVRLIAGHQRDCATCRETARLHVDPIDVFAAIPAAASPLGMKEVVVEQLVALGVPMTGSVSYRDPATTGSGDPGAPGGAARPLDDSTGAALAPPPRPTDPTVAPPPGDDGRSLDAAALTAAVRARSAPAEPDGRPGGTVAPNDSLPFAPTTSAPNRLGADPVPDPAPGPTPSPSAPATAVPSLAAAAAFGASAGSSLGGPGAEPSFAAPVVDADTPDRSRRWLIVAIGLVAVVVVAVVVVLTKGSSEPNTQSLTATDAERPVITTTSGPASSAPTTAAPVTSEAPATIDSTPSTVPGSTPTTARLAPVKPGPTTAPPTTAVPFPNFAGTTFAPSQSSVLTGNAPLTISWNVVADRPVTVVISGPNFSSTALSASAQPVCPVALTGNACDADPGVYSYVLAATDSLGRAVFSKTIQFTVTPRS